MVASALDLLVTRVVIPPVALAYAVFRVALYQYGRHLERKDATRSRARTIQSGAEAVVNKGTNRAKEDSLARACARRKE